MESPALYRGVGRDDLIKLYFYEGYNYCLIICFLFFVHGISLSLRQLKKILLSESQYIYRGETVTHKMECILKASKVSNVLYSKAFYR